ncbi:MBL fold metallo-hydrolase [Gordonia sp. CPCC 205515]|uniref:MBL fold metallo-hydrolase n=1 Tax=Gordonia sp. CPCC 205515 TaxID=3140791 RepID=UPI003AF394EF
MSEATLDWFGCATFRLTLGGAVVFLDAYIDRVDGAVGSGMSPDDIDTADWILVGHSHFDHLWGAERIARRTGATIVGNYETTRIMTEQGIPAGQLMSVSGGERIRLADDITVTVFPSLHSCVWSHRQMPDSDVACFGDIGLTYQEQLRRYGELTDWLRGLGADVVAHLQESDQGARGDGHTLVYLIESPAGSILFQDTSGYWAGILDDVTPDVAILAAAGRGNIDGNPVQGTLAQFVAAEVDLLRPQRVVLCHHDDWLPGFSRAIDAAPIARELRGVSPGTELVEIGYVSGYPILDGLTAAN